MYIQVILTIHQRGVYTSQKKKAVTIIFLLAELIFSNYIVTAIIRFLYLGYE